MCVCVYIYIDTHTQCVVTGDYCCSGSGLGRIDLQADGLPYMYYYYFFVIFYCVTVAALPLSTLFLCEFLFGALHPLPAPFHV